jgi:hypothetical protein
VFIDTPVTGNRSEAYMTDHGQMGGARPAPGRGSAGHSTRARPQRVTIAGVKMTTVPAMGEVVLRAAQEQAGEHHAVEHDHCQAQARRGQTGEQQPPSVHLRQHADHGSRD